MRCTVWVMALVAGVTLGGGVGAHQEPAAAAPTLTEQGVALFEQRQFSEAKKTLARALAANPADATAHAYLGLVLLNHDGEAEEAKRHLEEAVRLEPARARHHLWLGAVYSRQAMETGILSAPGFARKARASFEKAVELDPRDLEARSSLLEYYLFAPSLVGGSVAKAREQALAMTEIDRHAGLLAQARIAEHEKDHTSAERLYRSAIAVKPEAGEAYNQLGYLLLRTKRKDEAVSAFRTYVELCPGEANPHDSLAEGLLAQGKVAEAIAEYRKALAIDPRFASSYLGLAQCFERQEAWGEARAALKRYLELAPEGRRADEARDRLAKLNSKLR